MDCAEPAPALTAAERRLLERLATCASLSQIAVELFVSHNTVKSQAASIYRKLRVGTRYDAVCRARRLQLL